MVDGVCGGGGGGGDGDGGMWFLFMCLFCCCGLYVYGFCFLVFIVFFLVWERGLFWGEGAGREGLEKGKVEFCYDLWDSGFRGCFWCFFMFSFRFLSLGAKRKIKVEVVEREGRLKGERSRILDMRGLYEATGGASWGLFCSFALSFFPFERVVKSIDVLFYVNPPRHSLKIS